MKTLFPLVLMTLLFTLAAPAVAQDPGAPLTGGDPAATEPKAEEPKAEEPKAETPKAEEPKADPKPEDKKDEKKGKKDLPLKFKGDVRYRHETIDQGEDDANHRHRIRIRFGAFAELNDQLEFGFQLASGAGDPVSTNQTLAPAFTKKPMTIDLAYFQYKPLKPLSLSGGKLKNPFFRPGDSQLVWDSDLTPEGLALGISHELSSMKLFATGAALWIADRKGEEDDAHLLAGQAGASFKFGEMKLTVAGALFNYTKINGMAPVYDDDAFGNTLDAANLLANDFNVVDAGLQLDGKVAGLPFAVFGNFAMNLAADEEKTAFLAGFSLGEAKKARGWRVFYNYRKLERDAVFGTFSDSDFLGGGTGGAGHFLGAEYALSDHMLLALVAQQAVLDDADETDYLRVQLDLSVKF